MFSREKIKKISIVSIIFLLVTAVSIALLLFFNKKENVESMRNVDIKHLEANGNALNGHYNQPSEKQVLDDLKKSQINVTDKLSSCVVFSSGSKESQGKWVVENIKSNNVIMQCELYLGNKLISKSVPIYPDQYIESVNLLEYVEPGSYDATAYINYFSIETKNYISKAGYKIKLMVQ